MSVRLRKAAHYSIYVGEADERVPAVLCSIGGTGTTRHDNHIVFVHFFGSRTTVPACAFCEDRADSSRYNIFCENWIDISCHYICVYAR